MAGRKTRIGNSFKKTSPTFWSAGMNTSVIDLQRARAQAVHVTDDTLVMESIFTGPIWMKT